MKNDKTRCWAEVDLRKLAANVRYLRKKSKRGVIAVIKANGYGHGIGPLVRKLSSIGVRHFGVASPAEALEARAASRKDFVMLLSGSLKEEIPEIIKERIVPTISSWYEAEAFARVALKMRRTLPVHLKIDTGMGRLGIWHDAALVLARRIDATPGLRLDGIYTHLATADSHRGFAMIQIKRLVAVIQSMAREKIRPPMLHYANSAATLGLPQTGFNFVRPGLAMYGLSPIAGRFPLQPVLSFKSRLTLIKDIQKGRPLSYDSVFHAPHRMRVGTVAAGYADGYDRHLTNRSEVLVHGKRCRQLGRVTMDEIIVDLSQVPEARWGDTVTLIGEEGRESITAHELAKLAGTIPWTILTSLAKRVVRIYD
jgi:alanine racemase